MADADVLFAATTRGLLIYLDYEGLIKLHWSALILDELARALVDTGRKTTLDDAKAHEARLCQALPNASVSTEDVQAHYRAVAPAVRSAKDTHVAACAHYLLVKKAYPDQSAVALVSRNTRDFKRTVLAEMGIMLQRPDVFLASLIASRPAAVARALRRFRLDLTSLPAPEALLHRLARDGLATTVHRLQVLYRSGEVEL